MKIMKCHSRRSAVKILNNLHLLVPQCKTLKKSFMLPTRKMKFDHVIDTRKHCSVLNHCNYFSKEIKFYVILVKSSFQEQNCEFLKFLTRVCLDFPRYILHDFYTTLKYFGIKEYVLLNHGLYLIYLERETGRTLLSLLCMFRRTLLLFWGGKDACPQCAVIRVEICGALGWFLDRN